ncbi:MAG: IPTL-CTERM sorting domain-containing protein [Thermodesulfobacteriota bacterium]
MTDVRGLLSISFGTGFTPDLVSLSPEFATNDIFTDHTVTAAIISNGSPLPGVLVSFEVTSGPNEGQASDPGSGECTPNDDCTTDIDGRVSWTYTGSKEPGTDIIEAAIEGGETLTAEKLWISPARPIPTLSEWGMISAVVGLGLVGVWFAVRRKRALNI